ncbi:MAG: polysaccharide deacetylase family protein [Candidatus Latescibacterota bacterium]
MTTALALLAGAPLLYLASRRVVRTFAGLHLRRFPEFVYRQVGDDELGIPVFTYHSVGDPQTPDSVTPEAFEGHMRYLSCNGYQTLGADEVHDHLVNGTPVAPRSVVITFDDGRATVWTTAFPVLRRYGLRAVAFLVPAILDDRPPRRTLADYEAGRTASLDGIVDADRGAHPALSWAEVGRMHESGLVDFESHTLCHALIHYSSRIVDFVHPGLRAGYCGFAMPVLRSRGTDLLHQRPPLGTPLYAFQPRMGPARRFFDDEGLREACVEYVACRGGEEFFWRRAWRQELGRLAAEYRRCHALEERYETPEEQVQALRWSLAGSRTLIEERLSGHRVRHLCYPWHRHSVLASALAREAGYVTTFADINPHKPSPAWNDAYAVQRLLPTNEFGDDPFAITRIDARHDPVLSLPGAGRLSYPRRLATRLLRPPSAPGRR